MNNVTAPATIFDSMVAGEWNMQPAEMNGVWNTETGYYSRQLYKYLFGHFRFILPEHWKMNWFRMVLFKCGSLCVFYTKQYGWLPLPYTVLKLDEQYNPLVVQSATAYMLQHPVKGIRGLNCEIIQVADDFYGMHDIITHYAAKLANFDKAMNVNLINCGLGLYTEVSSPKEQNDIYKLYEQSSAGKPLVTVVRPGRRASAGRELKTIFRDAKANYLVQDFLDARRTLLQQFLTEVGIPNANIQKKERMITAEAESNSTEILISRNYILDNIRRGMDKVNEVSGLGLKVEPIEGEVAGLEFSDNVVGFPTMGQQHP